MSNLSSRQAAARTFEPLFAIGLMSGTSADGVDAAMVRTDGETYFEQISATTFPYEYKLRERLLRIAQHETVIDEVSSVEHKMTLVHVDACESLCESTGIQPQLIGFHGHTIRHSPANSITWQIGNPHLLAERMRCPVVSDFRRRDLAAGGEGAPLAPLFHRARLQNVRKPAAMLNLGGVANITWVDSDDSILAGDTGPGCGLLDAWISEHTGQPFDVDGAISSSGKIHDSIVDRFLEDGFFCRPLPRSADRFQFRVPQLESLSLEDGAATLCAATVRAIELATVQLPSPPKEIFVAGGGARNQFLVRLLNQRMEDRWGCKVSVSSGSDFVEADCFGWLAVRRLRGLVTSVPETTGCGRPVCGGNITSN